MRWRANCTSENGPPSPSPPSWSQKRSLHESRYYLWQYVHSLFKSFSYHALNETKKQVLLPAKLRPGLYIKTWWAPCDERDVILAHQDDSWTRLFSATLLAWSQWAAIRISSSSFLVEKGSRTLKCVLDYQFGFLKGNDKAPVEIDGRRKCKDFNEMVAPKHAALSIIYKRRTAAEDAADDAKANADGRRRPYGKRRIGSISNTIENQHQHQHRTLTAALAWSDQVKSTLGASGSVGSLRTARSDPARSLQTCDALELLSNSLRSRRTDVLVVDEFVKTRGLLCFQMKSIDDRWANSSNC